MNIPQDSFMLLSFINVKLRDFYNSIDDLCDDLYIDKYKLIEKLKKIGYIYNISKNQFIIF